MGNLVVQEYKRKEIQKKANFYACIAFLATPLLALSLAQYWALKESTTFWISFKEYFDEIADFCSILMCGLILSISLQLSSYFQKLETDFMALIKDGTEILSIKWIIFHCSLTMLASVVFAQAMSTYANQGLGFKMYLDEVADMCSILVVGQFLSSVVHGVYTKIQMEKEIKKAMEERRSGGGRDLPPECNQQ